MSNRDHTGLSDQELLALFNEDRDNKWLGILLERYTLVLYGVCMKYLKDAESAKDSVQQLFLKSITELNKYPVTHFSSWIYTMAKNHCLMQIRKGHGKIPLPITDRLDLTDDVDQADNPIDNEKKLQELEAALHLLNRDQRLCISQFYLEKKSYQEIAENTGFNMMQVKSYIQNGKRNLRILLEKK